jgi:hypothetical protein
LRKTRAIFSILAVVALAATTLVIAATSASADPVTKVTICHRTNSNSNPYVEITPDVSGVLDGHAAQHNEPFVWTPTLKASGQKWGDIIPPFDYMDSGVLKHFPGLNMDTLGGVDGKTPGSAILDNGCVVPDAPPPVVEHGDLVVTKTVVGDAPADADFTVHVACDDDSVNEDVHFGATGGTKTYSDLVAGINCTVEETDSAGASSVAYSPVDVSTNGIEIVAETDNNVTVTNTFDPAPPVTPVTPGPEVAAETAAAPAPVVAAPAFTG